MIDKGQAFEYEHDDNDNTQKESSGEFEQLFNESLKTFKEHSVVTGRVVQVRSGVVLVDLGYKSDGIIPIEQFTPDELQHLKPGDELQVYLESAEDSNGNLLLSREKAKNMQVWNVLNHAYETGSAIKGKVISKVKGGLSIDIGALAFLPGSQIDIKPVRNLDQFIGRVLEVKLIKMNAGRGNIVVSRRAILEKEQTTRKTETLATLAEGQVVKGTIKNITEYGAFIDLGGIDGLLHITDMSWGRIGHPSELFKVGDSVEVVVLKYDREKQKVSLGLKQKTQDPWSGAADRYVVGSKVQGKVVNLAEYGAFVELEHGVEGLVHVSEMSWTQKIRHPSKILKVGDMIEAQVLSIDPAAKRISLGIKQVTPNPWQVVQQRCPVGSQIEGKIKTITDFGAFVGLDEGIDGLIHISDMSWTKHVKHPSEVVKKGETVKAVVLNIDPQKERLSLGLKQTSPDPWAKDIPDRYKVGQDEKVKIVKTADFGVFAELDQGIEGLIPASEIPKESTGLKEGDEVTARIIKVDTGERKIALSIKVLTKAQDASRLQDFMNQQQKPDTTLGALLKERS